MHRVILTFTALAALIVAACGHPADPRAAIQALTGDVPADAPPDVPDAPGDAPPADPCPVPGAVPNDGLDDRAAILAALTARGCAHLVAGTYDVETPVAVAPARRARTMVTLAGGHLYGDGAGQTIVKFRGDARGADWEGVRLTGTSPELDHLTIETGGLANTGEQTHASTIVLATDAHIHDMTYVHPQRAGEHGGDCVQIVGYLTSLVLRTVIDHVDFAQCDRSGVAAHSGAAGLTITDDLFEDTGDQDVDGEGSGEGSRDWVIQRCRFKLGHAPQGAWAIQVELTDHVQIVDDVFDARGIFIFGTNVEIARNEISRTVPGAEAAIELTKFSSAISVHDNVITRSRLAGAGPIVRASQHGTGTPADLTFANNAIIQETDADVINATGTAGLHVNGNLISYFGAAKVGAAVSAIGGVGVKTTDVTVNSNTVQGPVRALASISGSNAGAGTMSVRDNKVLGAVAGEYGVYCQNVYGIGKVTGPVTVHGNVGMPASACGLAGFLQEVP